MLTAQEITQKALPVYSRGKLIDVMSTEDALNV